MVIDKEVALVGYSGHAYVLYDILKSMGKKFAGYCDSEYKLFNPYNLKYYGSECSDRGLNFLRSNNYFVAIGDNSIRKKIIFKLLKKGLQEPINAIHTTAIIGSNVTLGVGVMVAQNVVINAQAKIGNGVVCNTCCVVEHEVEVGDYSFIAPNSTLLGGVNIGQNCFVGANATVLQNISIGDNTTIGAGAVVIDDIPANSKVVGNPQRFI